MIAVTASAVRAALRSEGVRTSHDRSREGVRCPDKRSGQPLVSVDVISTRERHALTERVVEILTGRGFVIETEQHDGVEGVDHVTVRGWGQS